MAGGGRRQQAGDGGQEAELGFHFLWGVPRSLEGLGGGLVETGRDEEEGV